MKHFLLSLVLMVVFSAVALSQDMSSLVTDPDFMTMAGIIGFILFCEELIDQKWNLDGVQSQLRTVGIGILVATPLAWLQVFMFADPTTCSVAWYVCGPLVGIACAVLANFAFLLPVVKAVLEASGVRPKWGPQAGVGSKPQP